MKVTTITAIVLAAFCSFDFLVFFCLFKNTCICNFALNDSNFSSWLVSEMSWLEDDLSQEAWDSFSTSSVYKRNTRSKLICSCLSYLTPVIPPINLVFLCMVSILVCSQIMISLASIRHNIHTKLCCHLSLTGVFPGYVRLAPCVQALPVHDGLLFLEFELLKLSKKIGTQNPLLPKIYRLKGKVSTGVSIRVKLSMAAAKGSSPKKRMSKVEKVQNFLDPPPIM